jgi:hypothetical protein
MHALTTPAPYATATVPAPANTPTACDALSAPSVQPTWPPMSMNRAAGIVWYESIMAQSRSASQDATRFAQALGL